jgi:hypothetical protein
MTTTVLPSGTIVINMNDITDAKRPLRITDTFYSNRQFYIVFVPFDRGSEWIDIEQWAIAMYGNPGSVWDTNSIKRWTMNDSAFWFLDELDRIIFLLKWS